MLFYVLVYCGIYTVAEVEWDNLQTLKSSGYFCIINEVESKINNYQGKFCGQGKYCKTTFCRIDFCEFGQIRKS